jgi:hypothetical protein
VVQYWLVDTAMVIIVIITIVMEIDGLDQLS